MYSTNKDLKSPTAVEIILFFPFSAKEWWQFAGKCILNFIQERNKRQTWSYTVNRAQTIVKYVRVYTKHLTEPIEDINTTVSSQINVMLHETTFCTDLQCTTD